ncbi:MAG: ATP-binding protein [Verrucomicrobiota bacterium]
MMIAVVLLAAVIRLATTQPWLGLRLSAPIAQPVAGGPASALPEGAVVVAITGDNGDRIELEPTDLLEEPDVSPSYAAMARFFERQDRLATALRGSTVTLTLADERDVALSPFPERPLADLPTAFWVQLFVGGASFLIGAWVWSLRRDDAASRLLAAVGASTLTFSFAAAAYSTRELAIDGELFRVLSAINHFGALSFGACMIALFLTYPRRLVRPRMLLVLPAIIFPWWLADTLRLGFHGPAEGSHLPTMLEMLCILVAVGLQFWKTRGDPRARAALRWFGLSVAVGAGAFVFLIIAPNLFGAAPVLSQGYAFLFFLLVFAGVALGVARYRLFELETWAFRILFYLGGVALLLTLDSVLIYLLSLGRSQALGLSLIVTVLIYLPARDLLGRRVLGKGRAVDSHFRDIMDVALAVTPEAQNERWRALLGAVFDPLQIETGRAVDAPRIADDGLVLNVPATGALQPLRLTHARGGRRLFSSRDAAHAGELCAMLRHAIESRGAYEKGVSEERARIARDMHDNIGAQLLSALHSQAPEGKDTKIRETLADIRGIINNASGDGLPLEVALGELRYETAERLEAAGLRLDWRVEAGANTPLSPATLHALRSILRETVSNAIRHAGASIFAVEVATAGDSERLRVTLADNGRGLSAEARRDGNGLKNIRDRMTLLGGTLEMTDAGPGVRYAIELPVR